MSVNTDESVQHPVTSNAHPNRLQTEPVFVGRSAAVTDLLSKINLVALSEVPVLVTGETGTGKEIVAQLIHRRSARCNGAFVVVNSAAIPKDVVENELFGHEKEAFTGAISRTAGCFELAHDGTLFLDEIAEMHSQTQAKLLRAIENKSFRRLGGRGEVIVESRIVAATNRDIVSSLKSGEFREDLYYRLSVIEIALPPLRDRREDIEVLVDHFNKILSAKHGRPTKLFHSETLDLMRQFDWPGNVRELRNAVERIVLVCSEETVLPSHLPSKISGFGHGRSSLLIPIGTTSKDAEKMLIRSTLASVNNNKSAAARILGLSRKTLHAKLSRE
jgi:two-component system, NtrC family, response regulator HydG